MELREKVQNWFFGFLAIIIVITGILIAIISGTIVFAAAIMIIFIDLCSAALLLIPAFMFKVIFHKWPGWMFWNPSKRFNDYLKKEWEKLSNSMKK